MLLILLVDLVTFASLDRISFLLKEILNLLKGARTGSFEMVCWETMRPYQAYIYLDMLTLVLLEHKLLILGILNWYF